MEFLNEEFLKVTFRLIACWDLLRSLLNADLRRQVESNREAGARNQKPETRGRKPEARGQGVEGRRQTVGGRSEETGGSEPEVRGQKSEPGKMPGELGYVSATFAVVAASIETRVGSRWSPRSCASLFCKWRALRLRR